MGIRLAAMDGSTMVEMRYESTNQRKAREDAEPRKVTSMVVYAKRDRQRTPRFGSIWDKADGKYWLHPDPVHQAVGQMSIESQDEMERTDTIARLSNMRRNPLRKSFIESNSDSPRTSSFGAGNTTLPRVLETSIDLDKIVDEAPTRAGAISFTPTAKPYKDIETACCCDDEMLCCLSKCQGPCQARIAPAGWCSSVRSTHGHEEEWSIPEVGPHNVFDLTLSALQALPDLPGEIVAVDQVDRKNLVITAHVYTSLNFVDKMTFQFERIVYRQPGMTSVPGTKLTLQSCSSGLCPASFPLSCVFSTLLCWIPFCDYSTNATRLDRVKDLVRRSLRSEMRVEV
eukprot:TRINITY_DN6962_c0_g1_i1.p1 TRINITY_DN6962_c0_g1~~TRINITY_DN6962_c0_g1_i1.p1  ORF type:complete len:342 (+),score=57.47 TRINITY_DN6962_c0_g1_i1:119-1144(+)